MRDLEIHLAENRRTLSDVQPHAFDDLFHRAEEEVMGAFDWKSPGGYLDAGAGLLSAFGGGKKDDGELHAKIAKHLDDEKRKADASKGLSTGAKIGIAAGAVALLGVLVLALRRK